MIKICSLLLIVLPVFSWAQNASGVQVKDLGTPKSPGFQLVDIAPSNIEAPNTPKEFVVGVLQTFDANTGWPQNYSMEATPYWWVKKRGRNVYQYIGLNTSFDEHGKRNILNQNVFSAMKFTSVAASFISKDLIPDTITSVQKIFAGSINSRLIRVYQQKHIQRLKDKIALWAYRTSPESLAIALAGEDDPDEQDKILRDYMRRHVDTLADEIGSMVSEKPIFVLDIAGAFATYGIGDSAWQTGRAGIWATIASFVPLNYKDDSPTTNYLDLLVNGRFMYDQYAKAQDGKLVKSNHFDIGAKIGFEFNQFSFAFEGMYRNYTEDHIDEQHRLVGILSYKIREGLYVNGAYGKNFGDKDNLVSLFGLNWGFGSEKIALPD